MKRKWIQAGCFAAFLLLCLGVADFLHIFMKGFDELRFIEWDSAVLVRADGSSEEFDLQQLIEAGSMEIGEGDYWRFSAKLEGVIMGDNLAFICGSEKTILYLGEREIYHGELESDMDFVQTEISVNPEDDGKILTMEVIPFSSGMGIFPPSVQLQNLTQQPISDMAYAGYYDIPATMFAVVTVLAGGLFLLSLLSSKPAWSLLLVVAAGTILTARDLIIGMGSIFSVDEKIILLLRKPIVAFLPMIFLLIYAILNRKQQFRRIAAIATLGSILLLAAACLISYFDDKFLIEYVKGFLEDLIFRGQYEVALYWFTGWLVILCVILSALRLVYTLTSLRAETEALTQKNTLVQESYNAMKEGIDQTSALRHEMKNQILALNLLYQKGNRQELEAYLEELMGQQNRLTQLQFTENVAVNTILQSEAYRCAQKAISFRAEASVPEKLSIPEGDLCSLLINLLDNAVEAAGRTPKETQAYVLIKIKWKQGFLTVYCENSFDGVFVKNKKGDFVSTKKEALYHGFGLKQMSAIAEKYHSLLDVSSEGGKFIVQTALKLPIPKGEGYVSIGDL